MRFQSTILASSFFAIAFSAAVPQLTERQAPAPAAAATAAAASPAPAAIDGATIISANGVAKLDANTIAQLQAAGLSVADIGNIVGGNANNNAAAAQAGVGVSDAGLTILLNDLGGGNLANGANNMAQVLLQATANNPTIAQDVSNLLASQGIAADTLPAFSQILAANQLVGGQNAAALSAVPAAANVAPPAAANIAEPAAAAKNVTRRTYRRAPSVVLL